MNRFKHTISLTVTMATLATLLMVSVAVADTKVYPGRMCKPLVPSDARDYRGDISFGGIVKVNNADDVICPIMRDQTIGVREVLVQVDNLDQGEVARCFFFSYTEDANILQFFRTTEDFIGPGGGEVKFNQLDNHPRGALSIVCRLPVEAELVRYTVVE